MSKIILFLTFFCVTSLCIAEEKADFSIPIKYKAALIEAHSSVLQQLTVNKEIKSLLLGNRNQQKTLL